MFTAQRNTIRLAGWSGTLRRQAILLSIACCASVGTNLATNQRDHGFVLAFLIVLTLALASLHDLRSLTIPNHLVYPSFVLVILLQAVAAVSPWRNHLVMRWLGAGDSRSALIGFALIGSGAGLFFLLGFLGGGDAKLLALIGGCFGLHGAIEVTVYAAVLGVVVALVNIVSRGTILFRIRVGLANQPSTAPPFDALRPSELPFAPLLLLATVIHLVMNGGGGVP